MYNKNSNIKTCRLEIAKYLKYTHGHDISKHDFIQKIYRKNYDACIKLYTDVLGRNYIIGDTCSIKIEDAVIYVNKTI